MPTGWRLIVERTNRIEYYVAQAPDQDSSIKAVRKLRGLATAKITVAANAPSDDLFWMTLPDGHAMRVAPFKV